MKKAERTERMRDLSRLALGILRRCGDRAVIDRNGLRYRRSDVRHNEFRLALAQPFNGPDDGASTLEIRFEGKVVLHVEWEPEQVIRTSYLPGAWEASLHRYDQAPVFSGKRDVDGWTVN